MKVKKKNKWVKTRHKIITALAHPILGTYTRLKYRPKIQPFKERAGRQFLVLYNHQTALDQFLVAMTFKGAVYYVASEDLFSNGFVGNLLKWAVAPIPIKKQANDSLAVMNCIRVAKEGGTIAIAPEGNRTFSGTTEFLKPSIVKLVRVLKLPVAIMRIEGGYGVHPRWSDCVRKGRITTRVSRVYEVDEIKSLSDEELFNSITKELYVDDYTFDGDYLHRRRAEYLERAIYVCPKCGLSKFESKGDKIRCKNCDLTVTYGTNKNIESESEEFNFKTVKEWYDYQCEFVRNLNIDGYYDKPFYTDKAAFFEVELYKRKKRITKEATISIYADKFVVGYGKVKKILDFANVSAVSVLGRNKLNVYHDNKVYQFKSDKRFNALKYVNLYYICSRGEEDVKFLGL